MEQENTNNQNIMTNKDRIISVARQLDDNKIHFLALLEIIKELKKETYDLLDEANTPDKKTKELIESFNAADAIVQYLKNTNNKEIKTLAEGKENGTKNEIFLYQAIKETFNAIDYANQKDIEIKCEIESITGERIYANEINLKRAITNIYEYLDAKTKTGTITIGAEKLEDKIKIYINTENQGIELVDLKKLRVQIQESQNTAKLDEPYMKLVSAKSLVEKLDGMFEVESDANKKTTISMYLNRTEKQKYV